MSIKLADMIPDIELPAPRKPASCATCNAFKPNAQANPKHGEPRQGWCLASPPVAMPGMQAAPALIPGGQPTMVMQGVWPPTLADRWCRAYEAAVED